MLQQQTEFSKMSEIRLLSCLQHSSAGAGSSKIALIFLHTELTADEVAYHRQKFEALRSNAVFTCAADSGCNFLHRYFRETSQGGLWLPDLIAGDFDSVEEKVLEFYRGYPTVRIEHTPDQDEADFTKALRLVAEEIATKKLEVEMIVAVCSGKGRFDHNIGNINTLYTAPGITEIPVLLMSELEVQYIVPSGARQTLVLDTGWEGMYCGLFPIGGASVLTTSGLKWNLKEETLQFGGVVSSSNEVTADRVTVQTTLPLLWTINLKQLEPSPLPTSECSKN